MAFWSRIVTAIQAGVQTAIKTYNEKALIPDDTLGWDDYAYRLFRYSLNDAYYNNTIYQDILTFAATHREKRKLYAYVRGIYNPVARLCDLYVAKVYGGNLDYEKLMRGAIPIAQADPRLRTAICQLWLWSNWGQQKSLYVRNGAKLGDSFIKIVDEPDRRKVRMEVLHPSRVRDVTVDAVDNVKAITIEYLRSHPERPDTLVWYTEIIDGEWYRTFLNNQPYAFYQDATGKMVDAWRNPYGFVPVVKTSHKDMGLRFGASAFHMSLPKIDELNDAASLLNDQIRKTMNPPWYLAGVNSTNKKDIKSSKSEEDRDSVTILTGPEGSQPYPMVMPVNIADAGANVDRILLEIERDMPELALYKIREAGNMTAPGVSAGYSDAIDRFVEARGNYDDGLVRAQKMGVSIGGFRGYDGFEGYTLDSFAAGALEHSIAERPVINDTLSKKEKMDVLQANGAPLWLVLAELDYAQDVIDRAMLEKEAQARMAARGFADSIFGTASSNETDEAEDEDVTDGEEAPEEA